ncbi:MAG: hypothetical protein RJB62_635, partial [Pseudomonadota bacterium]
MTFGFWLVWLPTRKRPSDMLKLASLCVLAASVLPSIAQAQLANPDREWTVRAGGALLYAPAFVGSDDYQLQALPYLSIEYRDIAEISYQRGLRWNVLRTENFVAGPIARYDFGRQQDGDNLLRIAGDKSRALRGLGDIDGSIELGGFARFRSGVFVATAELRQAVNGHEGLVGDAGIAYDSEIDLFGLRAFLTVGPELRFTNARYAQEFFGVTPLQSFRSGLPTYRAYGGVLTYGGEMTLIVPLHEQVFAA